MIKKWSLLKTLLSILSWLLFLWYGGATTIFSPGDIFIITANANPDMIEFVSRVDMNSGTIIRFSDDSRTSTWTWRATEWYITFTSNTNIPKGTIIRMSWLHTTTQTVFPTWFGTITKNNTFDLSTAGESILVYQGTPYNQISPTFLYWLGFGSWTIWINSWIAGANTSYLPSNINLWTTAILITSGANVQYNCSNTALLDASFTTAINNQNNWNKGTLWFPFPPSTCVFDFTQPILSIDLWSWQADFTSGSNIKFKVTSSEPLNTGSFTCSDLVFWWDLSGSTTCSSITQIAPFNNTAFEVSLTVSPGMSWYGDIDMNILSWTVSDVAGNSNTVSTVINNYIIVDILAPVITLSWSTTGNIIAGSSWTDPGATCIDNFDSTCTVVASGNIDANVPWTYTITYTATDDVWNIASVMRIISVIDGVPIVTLNWSGTITIPRSSGYIEQWAIWNDFIDGSGSITTPTIISWPNTWSVDTYGMPWSHTLEYVYIDTAGNTGSATRTVIVQNPWVPDPQDDAYTMYQDTSLDLTTPPQVIVANDNNMEYTTSWGLVTGPTNGTIIMTGQWFIYTPNTGFVWNDTFIYELCNILNQCDSALVTITIIDTQSPLLTLSGSSTETIEAGIPWVDPGYICTDATACTVVTTGMVNSSLPWTYTLIYTATDTEWNFTTVTRTVIVIDTTAPVIVLNGSTSLTLTQWTAFSDSGASWTDSVDGSGVVALPTSWSVNINIPWIYTLEYTYTDSAGNNGNIVTRTVTVQAISSATGTISTWSSWWWGGWYILQKDNCPDWDHSPTHYDGVCKWDNEPVDEQTFNPSIWSTCFKPLNKKTIDQGIQVSEAFKTAHQMLYSYQLTKRQGTRDYRPFDYLTREEAARFMVEFAQNVLCRKPTRSYNNNFSDINNANPTLTKFIRESYNYGIFNGNSDGTFRPNDRITNDELSAIMVRLVTNSILDEPEWDRAAQYRSTLSQYAQISILNNEGRWNIAEVIYDLYRNNTYILNKNGYIIQ